MELRHLRYFIAIVESGSLSRAAQQVKVTQSALTRSIKALETSVGVSLLDRGASGATPTRSGAAMYEYAKFLVHESDRIRTEVRQASGEVAGKINLGLNPIFAGRPVQDILSVLDTIYDRLAVQIQEGDIEETLPLLLSGQIDLIISPVPVTPIRPNLNYERLGPLRWDFFVAPDHPAAGLDTVPFSALLDHRWALLDRQHEMDFLGRYLAARGDGMPKDAVRTGSVALMRSLIVDSGLIGLMPAPYMAGTGAVALPIEGPSIVRPVGMLSRTDSRVSHTLSEFTEICRTLFGKALSDDHDIAISRKSRQSPEV